MDKKYKMKIVILDGYALNPGDLSWKGFEQLGNCTVYDHSSSENYVERAINADAVITNKIAFTGDLISKLKNLKYIGVLATGYNNIDTEAAKKNKIVVTNVPSYATDSVAQNVFAHILNLTFHLADHDRTVRDGKWSKSREFCYWDHPLVELSGLTLGIIGAGQTGQATARIALAFGMKVVSYDVHTPKNTMPEIKPVPMEALLSQSDIVSLHCPLTKNNEGFMNASLFSKMKKTAFLVNTARGPLVNEQDLADALNNGTIAGAGIDVVSKEPPKDGNPLFSAKNCFITPHIAWATFSARTRLMKIAVENLRAFIDGNPQNVVNR